MRKRKIDKIPLTDLLIEERDKLLKEARDWFVFDYHIEEAFQRILKLLEGNNG